MIFYQRVWYNKKQIMKRRLTAMLGQRKIAAHARTHARTHGVVRPKTYNRITIDAAQRRTPPVVSTGSVRPCAAFFYD